MNGNKKMVEEELIDLIVTERINMILSREVKKEEISTLEEGEQVIHELGEEVREKVERYLNLIIMQGAEDEMKLYRAGIEDGIRIMKRICFLKD